MHARHVANLFAEKPIQKIRTVNRFRVLYVVGCSFRSVSLNIYLVEPINGFEFLQDGPAGMDGAREQATHHLTSLSPHVLYAGHVLRTVLVLAICRPKKRFLPRIIINLQSELRTVHFTANTAARSGIFPFVLLASHFQQNKKQPKQAAVTREADYYHRTASTHHDCFPQHF